MATGQAGKLWGRLSFAVYSHLYNKLTHVDVSTPGLQVAMRVIFIGQCDALKYDIIWSENGNVIDHFIPEILTLKE